MEFDTGLETLAHLDADLNPGDGPEFTVKVEPYYWNLAEALSDLGKMRDK